MIRKQEQLMIGCSCFVYLFIVFTITYNINAISLNLFQSYNRINRYSI